MPEICRFLGIIVRMFADPQAKHHKIYRITSVSVVGPHSLHLRFNDGTSKTVDLSSALAGELYEPLRAPRCSSRCALIRKFIPLYGRMVQTSILQRFMIGTSFKMSGILNPTGLIV